jgi:hypothetical protein
LSEPARPRPELAFATKVIELAQQDEKGVACGLSGEILDIAVRETG